MIFIDTGPFVARYVARDQYHSAAVDAWKDLARLGLPCYTSNFVLDETITLLGRRADHPFAAERARRIYASDRLTVLRPDADAETEAVALFTKFADQRVSFTDCVSFVLMRRQRIVRAFSYDRHFQHAGFRLWPQ